MFGRSTNGPINDFVRAYTAEAATILYDEGLTQLFGGLLRNQARRHICERAGDISNQVLTHLWNTPARTMIDMRTKLKRWHRLRFGIVVSAYR